MDFRLLGTFEVRVDGVPLSIGGPKQRAVLAMLLLEPGRVVSTDRLVDGLWRDDPPQRAAATIHVYVSKLRKVLEPDRSPRAEPTVLLTRPPGYLAAVDPEAIDVFRFDRLARTAHDLLHAGCPAGAAVLFREALGLWQGAPLADLTGEPFSVFEVPRLEEMRVNAIEDRFEADLMLGRSVELVPDLEGMVARQPYRERLRGQLMLALYRSGQQAEALAAYQAARATLVDELGLEPGRELRELEAAILVQDPDLAPSPSPPTTAVDARAVLHAVLGADPDDDDVDRVVAAGATSARLAEEALRRTIEAHRTSRLTHELARAGEVRAAWSRARRVVAGEVLDRRSRAVGGHQSAPGHTAAAAIAPGACPYKGLLRFEAEDAPWYFGRERLVADLLAMVAASRAVTIVGASGSGKSSLTRAGLLASLRDDALPRSAGWPALLVSPGADPVLELARALTPLANATSHEHVRDRLLDEPETVGDFARRGVARRGPDASVIVVVDQLEEVFTACHDAALRARFLDVLVHAALDPDCPARVVTAVRADYLGRCAEHPAFGDLASEASLLVGAMRSDEVQRAVEGPAWRAGLIVEDGLVDRVLDDLDGEPGGLPLLETALLETWNRRRDDGLTIAAYEAAGGVRGAVARLAEDVHDRLSENEQAIARGIFLRLAEPGLAADDVRRRAPLEELLQDERHARVLATLVDNRLVVTGDTTAEVAHEALIREWPRLRAWLEEDREGRRVHRALSNAAADWDASGEPEDLLFRGSRLVAAAEVADAHPEDVHPLERRFLSASRDRQDVELRTARRTAHRLRRLTAAMAILLVVASVAVTFALVQRSRADREAAQAEAAAAVADARRLASEARGLVDAEPTRALLLAVEARRLDESIDTDAALAHVLAGLPAGTERLFDGERHGWRDASDLAERTVVTGDGVRILDLRSGRTSPPLAGSPTGDATAWMSRDGTRVVAADGHGAVGVWDATSRRRTATFDLGAPGPAFLAFDPTDAGRVFSVAHDGTVTAWDVTTPTPRSTVLLRSAPSSSSDFPKLLRVSGDGRRLLVSDPLVGPTTVLDAATGEVQLEVPGTVGDISDDGSVVVTSLPDTIAAWDGNTGGPAGPQFSGLTAPTPLADLSPNGAYVAVGDRGDQRVHVLDTATGNDVMDAIPASTSIPIPEFLPDGRLRVAARGANVIVRLAAADLPPFARVLVPGGASFAHFTRDGRRTITMEGRDGPRRVWDSASGAPVAEVATPRGAEGTFTVPSPDHRHLAGIGRDGTRVWVSGRAAPILTVPADPDDPARQLVWSPTGRILALVHDRRVDLWRIDRARTRRLQSLRGFGAPAPPPWTIQVRFGPDEMRCAWDLRTASPGGGRHAPRWAGASGSSRRATCPACAACRARAPGTG